MSLYEELFADILGDSRPKSPEVAQESPAENGSTMPVIAQSPQSPALAAENVGRLGDAPCLRCQSGQFWHDGTAWHCADCEPPTGSVDRWRCLSGGKVPDPPLPNVPWPQEMNDLLRRVSTAFEWSDTDRRDFMAWARRSADALADAADFLCREAATLHPAAGRLPPAPTNHQQRAAARPPKP